MKFVKLSEAVDLINGFAFKSRNYVDSGIRIIRIANVQDGYISDEHPCFYPENSKDEISKYILNEGDMLISLTGNVGRVGILAKEFLPAALNQRVCCVRIKKGIVLDLRFLYYYFLRKQFVQDCIKASKGMAQLNLSTKWLENYPIPLPELAIQKEIVLEIEESLSQLDSAVETLKKTKQQLEIYRQAVLKEAFRDKSSWEKLTLDDLSADFRNGYGKKPDDQGRYRLLRISAVRPMSIDYDEYRLNITPFDEKTTIKENDLLFTRYNGSVDYVGMCAYVKSHKGEYGYPDKLIRCRLKNPNETIAKFLQYYLNHGEARQYIRERVKTTSGQNGIAGSDIKKVPICLPTDDVQAQVIDYIEKNTSICDEIERSINQSLQQAEALRQSILKKALNGE